MVVVPLPGPLGACSLTVIEARSGGASPERALKRLPWMNPAARLYLVLAVLSGLVMALGLGLGSTGWHAPWLVWQDSAWQPIVWEVRAPRTLGAWLVGALLGWAGALAQGLFRNPLAEPYLLGSSSGASLAVAFWVALGGGAAFESASAWMRWGVTGAAFIGALAGVMLTLALARGAAHTLRLLLAGVVVGVVLGAVTSLVVVAMPGAWRAMQGFMLGNTALLGWQACGVMAIVLAWLLPLGQGMARVLDALTLGEDTARSLGVPLSLVRVALVGLLALATATAVAQAGLVAFVGLAAPHLVRRQQVLRHGPLLLGSALMGGVLLSAADVLSRALLAPAELPVGVLTAVLGGGYLIWLMHRRSL